MTNFVCLDCGARTEVTMTDDVNPLCPGCHSTSLVEVFGTLPEQAGPA